MGVSRGPWVSHAFAGDLPSLWGSAAAVPFAAVMLSNDEYGVDGELGCCPGSDSCSQCGGLGGRWAQAENFREGVGRSPGSCALPKEGGCFISSMHISAGVFTSL